MSDTLCKHRQNGDNSWDSICPKCSLIIARVNNESDLSQHERQHVCDPAIFCKRDPLNFCIFFAR